MIKQTSLKSNAAWRNVFVRCAELSCSLFFADILKIRVQLESWWKRRKKEEEKAKGKKEKHKNAFWRGLFNYILWDISMIAYGANMCVDRNSFLSLCAMIDSHFVILKILLFQLRTTFIPE